MAPESNRHQAGQGEEQDAEMTLGTLYVGFWIAAMWLVAFRSWRLRNWRATVVLGCGTAAIVGVGIFPPSAALWLRGAICAAVILLVLTRRGLLSIEEVEYSFIEQYDELLRQMADLKRRTPMLEAADHVAAFANIVELLEALEAPSTEWADLKADTVRELRRRLVLMRLSMQPPTETLERANAEWSEIEQRFQRMVKARSNFWAGWPRFFAGSDG